MENKELAVKRRQVIGNTERLGLPAEAVEAWEESVKPAAEMQVLAARIEYDRYPNQEIFVEDLEKLHEIIDDIFIDDPMRFKCSPDYNFKDWMNKGERVDIRMVYVTREFLDGLEPFECFD